MELYKHKGLQDLCKDKGVSTCGTKAVLYERLVSKGYIVESSSPAVQQTDDVTENYIKWNVIALKKM